MIASASPWAIATPTRSDWPACATIPAPAPMKINVKVATNSATACWVVFSTSPPRAFVAGRNQRGSDSRPDRVKPDGTGGRAGCQPPPRGIRATCAAARMRIVKIKGTCGHCGRDLYAEQVIEGGGRCPWCGRSLQPDYAVVLVDALRDAESAGSTLENALEKIADMRPKLELDVESIFGRLRDHLRRLTV